MSYNEYGDREINLNKYVKWIVPTAALLLLGSCSIGVNSINESSVIFNRFNGGVRQVSEPGLFFKIPLVNSTRQYDTKIRKDDFEDVEGMSADSQVVTLDVAVNWQYDSNKISEIYKDIKGDPVENIVNPAIIATVKDALGAYKIGEIARNRSALKESMLTKLQDNLEERHINVINAEILNVDYSDIYDAAIEAKQVAEQRAEEAQNKKRQTITESEAIAEKEIIEAKAAANKKRLQAQANADAIDIESKAQAEANRRISETLTQELIQQNMVEKWNGELPKLQVTGGGANGNGTFFQVPLDQLTTN